MRKHFILILVISALICITAMPALAAKRNATSAETNAVFARQASLSQKDVDIYTENAAAFRALASTESLNALSKTTGLSTIRIIYVKNKVELGYIMLQQPDYGEFLTIQGEIPESLVPTSNEMDVIKRNKAALKKIFK